MTLDQLIKKLSTIEARLSWWDGNLSSPQCPVKRKSAEDIQKLIETLRKEGLDD